MQNKPLISVIVPVYNLEAYIEKCLTSLAQQSYDNFEVLVVNDGSTDGSPVLLDAFGARDPRFKIFHKPNGGVSSARNLGLDQAAGDYLGFVDGDDWVAPDFLQTFLDLLAEGEADIAIVGHYLVVDDKLDNENKINTYPRVLTREQAIAYTTSQNYYEGYVWNKLFSRHSVGNTRFDEGIHLAEDTLFCCTCMKNADRVLYDEGRRPIYYLYRADSSRRGNIKNGECTLLTAYDKIGKVVDAIGDPWLRDYYRAGQARVAFYVFKEAAENTAEHLSLARRLLSQYRENFRFFIKYDNLKPVTKAISMARFLILWLKVKATKE